MAPERSAGHVAYRTPFHRPADREVPVPHRGAGTVSPAGGADPRGAAEAFLVRPAVQPARRDPRPGDQARHGERGAVPAPLPAGAFHSPRHPRAGPVGRLYAVATTIRRAATNARYPAMIAAPAIRSRPRPR